MCDEFEVGDFDPDEVLGNWGSQNGTVAESEPSRSASSIPEESKRRVLWFRNRNRDDLRGRIGEKKVQMAGKSSPKKPSFFKVLLDDFSQHLRIPHAFIENFSGQSLHKCALRGSSGQWWAMKPEERENGLFFHGGWQGFVKDHSLEIGNFLVFDYDGDSKFEVTIYDRSASEKDVELARRRSGNSVSSMNKGSRARVKDEILDLDQTKIYNEDTENKTNIADKRSCKLNS
ncbi:putative B3 domain-containing protein Os03g0621600 [Pyrus x bretschneideri]|uniref:putative B3 domain-containing protein Os03g0621600 n=1 Tax=Pyrus x bretschneideri TaxID=225117 RepID=UPI00202F183D|nr:putative B3 domain-containing protein Os03g0621600 [Pyrus x bretschneideri]